MKSKPSTVHAEPPPSYPASVQSVPELPVSAAAAVSSSFNAPIAGVFFELEVVIGHYALSAFAPIVIASVVGTMISRTHFGDFPAFNIPAHTSVSALEFPAFALLGILCAFMAVIFMKSVAATRLAAQKIPGPAWWQPAGDSHRSPQPLHPGRGCRPRRVLCARICRGAQLSVHQGPPFAFNRGRARRAAERGPCPGAALWCLRRLGARARA